MKLTCTFIAFSLPAAAADYAAWATKNPAGSWTKATEAAVTQAGLPRTTPRDIDRFCPSYAALNPMDRTKFWVGLLSAVARPESGLNPAARHVERFNDKFESPVISRGLLQISLGTAKSPALHCAAGTGADLEKAELNLACGARIMANLVKRDGTISNHGSQSGRGGARAWPVLRHQSKKFPAIIGYTRQLPFCTLAK